MGASTDQTKSFVHLHVHSEYSMLDGSARVKDLMDGCREMGMPAIALTDHGSLFGAHEFHAAAGRAGVKPIVGLEAYVAPKTHRSERRRVRWGSGGGDDVSGGGAFTHMTLWAETTAGMHNLFRMATRASMEGFFYKPRADRQLLAEYASGLIATTGCPSGEVQTYLRLGQYDEAVASAAEFRDIFGAGNYFVELMDHDLAIEKRARDDLLRLAKDLSLPLVATNDLHYTRAEDAAAHEVLLCVQSGSTMADPKRFRFSGSGYYLKSPAEMRALFRELPEACDNTLAIAERCSAEFTHGEGRFMPRFPCPPGHDETSWFLQEVEEGLQRRYPNGITAEARKRADYESEVIISKGFPGYYLVVADFMQWAKDRGIRTGVRGSGAGSLCAYAMRITDLDPLEYKLTFERFLNPERQSLPDFDVDFDERRRGEVISYVIDRYGSDRVAQIVTYGTIKAKQAVKDASRVLGHAFSVGDRITKAMPPAVMGKDVPLPQIFNPDHARYSEGGELRDLYGRDSEVKNTVDTAMGIEGLKRQWGVHAAGVIMASEPLIDIIPLMKREQDGAIITQFDYPTCESLGLVKMDFLGLRNLTILGDAVENIRLSRGIDIDLDALGADPTDSQTFELIGRGDTLGVFQLDSTGMRSLLRLMEPKRIQDIMASIALYRPGPMGIDSHVNYALRRKGEQPITYPHPGVVDILTPVLEDNYGLIVYQEDVIEVARQLAGYTLGRADMLRRAMGKKKKEVLDAEYKPFADGMRERGFSDAAVQAVWDALLPFADYGFGKAHAAAYGLVSYWTAYLKSHYPAEYMAAVLESVKDDKTKMAIYLTECRRLGIHVLPPDVNESQARFTPVGDDIRFGLNAVRNVGGNVVASIVEARKAKGYYQDFPDFLGKIDAVACNKRTVASLVKAGAFDSLGHTRKGLIERHAALVDGFSARKRSESDGQYDLFDTAGQEGAASAIVGLDLSFPTDEWDKTLLLSEERDMLGLYVSDHPLRGLEHILAARTDATIAALHTGEHGDGATLTVGGIVSGLQRKVTKKGDAWATATIEDLNAQIDCLVFPSTYQMAGAQLTPDAIVFVTGRLDKREDVPRLMASDITAPDLTSAHEPVELEMLDHHVTPPIVHALKETLHAYPGPVAVRLRIRGTDKTTVYAIAPLITPAPDFWADLKATVPIRRVG